MGPFGRLGGSQLTAKDVTDVATTFTAAGGPGAVKFMLLCYLID